MKYCKNCAYCRYEEFASLGVNWGWFCKNTEKITLDSIGHKTITILNCEKLNQEHRCAAYKRKWWKFWAEKG